MTGIQKNSYVSDFPCYIHILVPLVLFLVSRENISPTLPGFLAFLPVAPHWPFVATLLSGIPKCLGYPLHPQPLAYVHKSVSNSALRSVARLLILTIIYAFSITPPSSSSFKLIQRTKVPELPPHPLLLPHPVHRLKACRRLLGFI